MNAAIQVVLVSLRRSIGAAVASLPDGALVAFAEELVRTQQYVRELRRWFDGKLADPDGVIAELHAAAWVRLCAGVGAAEIKAAYTPVARLNRGRDALRRQRTERKYVDQLVFERGSGNRHTSAKKSEEPNVAGKHHT